MAIALVGSAVVGSGIAHTSTPSYTVGASSNLVIASIASARQITAVTYGGTPMTIMSSEDTVDASWITLAYLLNPPTGANNFAFTAAAGSLTAFASDYSGIGSADGAFVTNNESGSLSLTTNVALAGTNEWVMCAAITGHLANTFSTTANQTVRQQDQGFLSGALYDSAAGFGSGTVGFVTTITGSSPRIWVVMQAFTASGGSTPVIIDAPLFLENGAIALKDINAPLENLAAQTIDKMVQSENLLTAPRTQKIWAENLLITRRDASIFSENLAAQNNNSPAQLENLGATLVQHDSGLPLEFLLNQRGDKGLNLENLSLMQRDVVILGEFLSQQNGNISLFVENLATSRREQDINLENTGTFLLTTDSGIALEFLTSARASLSLYNEITANVINSLPLKLETALSLLTNAPLRLENLTGQLGESFVQLEFVGPVGVSLSAPLVLEFGAALITDARLWLEIIGVPVLHPSGAFSLKAPAWRYGLTAPGWRYVSVTPGTTMPAIASLPPLGLNQSQTMAIDFGVFLPPGVTLVGSPSASVTTTFGEDLSPNSRITVPPSIGTVPQNIGGTGRANTAVLWRMGECVPNVVYVVDISCMRSDGDVAEASTRFTCLPPS